MGTQSSKEAEARILMLGLDAAGKSTLLYKLKYNESVITVPTIGFNVEMIESKKKTTALTVWDIGGQDKMRPHWKDFYQDTSGLVFVLDSSDRRRLDEAKREFTKILRNEALKGLPVVIFANKQDVAGAMSVADITEKFNFRKTCSDRDWFVQPCSAIAGSGLEDGFRKVLHLVKTSSDDKLKDTVQYLRSKSIKSMKR
ncbi:ADP-ribosylation factor-like protein 14 [Megalops cyprinoides]|uniref:ADP-ribosylation factor-like protein 14 n=1 Tax=Megalops cyprinoides TaxID=118141 RepID=UPI001863CE84|nr:ADP-ribosylation factor-like protein 14 [Megalops cyprinoides]